MIEELYEKAPCGYFSFDDDKAIFVVNLTLASILKYSKDELLGQNVEKIFTISTRIFFQTHFFPLVKMHGHAEEIFLTLLTKDGEHIPVLLNAERTSWQQTVLTCCACIVVPNRKKFEDELVAARNEAQKALEENTELLKAKSDLQLETEKLDEQIRIVKNQNQELKQFNHVITHSLKEPVRKILIYADKIRSEVQSPFLGKLVKSTDQMKTVVTGLQQYVWLNEKGNDFTHVNLREVVQHAAKQVLEEKGTDLLSIDFDEISNLDADAEQLDLLFYHLLSNAVKFRRGEKALVRIRSTVMKQNTLRWVQNKYNYEDFIKLEVTDEGIGFDALYREHIFELFRKLHDNEGQGLGLALSRKIAENHRGFIEADSKIGVFTKITVWLPVRQSISTKTT